MVIQFWKLTSFPYSVVALYANVSLCSRAGKSALSSLSVSLPTAGPCCQYYHVSSSPVILNVCFFHLCSRYSFRPQFFLRRNCSGCRCRFGVYVAASEFRLFLCCHLGPASSLFSYLVFLYRKYLGYSKKFLDMQRSRRIRCGEETVNRSKLRVFPVSEGEVKEYGMEEMYQVGLTELFPNMMETNRINWQNQKRLFGNY